MHGIPMIRSTTVRPLLDALERSGTPLGPRFSKARALLKDPNALLPVVTAGGLFEEAARRSGLEDFAFRVASAFPVLELGDWGALIARSATVAGFVSTLVHAAPRFNSGQSWWAAQRGEEVWLRQHLTSRLVEGRRAGAEYALMLILQVIRLAAGPGWRPREIHLEGAPPRHAAALAAQAERAVHFHGVGLTIVFPARVMSLPFPPLSPPAMAAATPAPSGSFPGSVRQLVEALVKIGTPELPIAAEAARMSERSLQRRLSECGLRFTRLVEEARFESARRLLSDRSVKIVEISAELGYTDSANFTRAFRRWSGMSPQAFRQAG